jgi:hypothetical protein
MATATGVDNEEWLDSQEPKLMAIVEGGPVPRIAGWATAAVLFGDPLHVASASYNEPAAPGGQGQPAELAP